MYQGKTKKASLHSNYSKKKNQKKKSDFSSRFIPSFYLLVRTPPLPLLSRQTGPDRSPENSSWSLHCQWSGKLQTAPEYINRWDLDLDNMFCIQYTQVAAPLINTFYVALLCCEDAQGGRRLRRICCLRSRILCLSCWISLSLSPSSSPSSSCRRMLYFISSMAAIRDSEMLKCAFSCRTRFK